MSNFSQHGAQLANALSKLDKRKRNSILQDQQNVEKGPLSQEESAGGAKVAAKDSDEDCGGDSSPRSVRFKVPHPIDTSPDSQKPNGAAKSEPSPLTSAFDPPTPSPKVQQNSSGQGKIVSPKNVKGGRRISQQVGEVTTKFESGRFSTSKHAKKKKMKRDDFEFGDELGRGAYAKVVHVTCINEAPPDPSYKNKTFALKIVSKAHLVRYNKQHCVINEKKAMQTLNHSNIVKLFSTFQDKSSLYFVLELCPNGELFRLVYNRGKLPLEMCRFYSAEMVHAVEYLHRKEIIHRDLKPENILLSESGHLKITDFGTAKVKGEDDKQTNRGKSFVGTAEYVSPELLKDEGACPASDLWALGCIIYQMICGKPPFKGESEYLTFQKILNREMDFDDDFDVDAKDLVDKLLVIDPEKRLGATSFEEIKAHSFFQGLDFASLYKQRVPCWVEVKKHTRDTSLGADFSDDDSSDEEKDKNSDRGEVQNGSISSTQNGSSVEDDSDEKWKGFLGDGENILFRGRIEKRGKNTFWTKKRMLLLTDLPRFLYISERTMIVKGEIKWSANLWVELKDQKAFNVHTPRRTYHIKGLESGAREWVDRINQLIQQHELMSPNV